MATITTATTINAVPGIWDSSFDPGAEARFIGSDDLKEYQPYPDTAGPTTLRWIGRRCEDENPSGSCSRRLKQGIIPRGDDQQLEVRSLWQ
jgi:hypothetical protein